MTLQDWFFDMIIGFLRSPRWKTPVMSFLDEHCIVFDSEEENKLEFTAIHQKFKKIVEDLLAELMAELGVTDQQFVEACEKAAQNPVHKKIVDQIMAVDNFSAFKRLMIKRNNELTLQAEAMMAQQTNPDAAANAQAPATGSDPTKEAAEREAAKAAYKVAQELERQEEEEMIRRAIEESEKLEQHQKAQVDEEEEMIRQAILMSQQEEDARIARQKTAQAQEEADIAKAVAQV